MNIHPAILVGAYILIGIFIASALCNFDRVNDDFDLFMLVVLFWPILIAILGVLAVFAIPYILGKWVGQILEDLLR